MELYEELEEELVLTPVEVNSLSLAEALEELLNGKVIVLQDYEKTRGLDILVRLDDRKYKVTEISHDSDILPYEEPYWQIHNVSINAISLHNAYKKETYDNLKKYKYLPGRVVHADEAHKNLVSIIEQVFMDDEENIYYTLGDREGYFTEEEINPYKGN